MKNNNKKESSDTPVFIPKQTSADYEHPQFKINKKKLNERLAVIKNYSVGLIENVMISRMVSFLDTKLPLNHDEIRNYLVFCFKTYNEMNSELVAEE